MATWMLVGFGTLVGIALFAAYLISLSRPVAIAGMEKRGSGYVHVPPGPTVAYIEKELTEAQDDLLAAGHQYENVKKEFDEAASDGERESLKLYTRLNEQRRMVAALQSSVYSLHVQLADAHSREAMLRRLQEMGD